MASIFDQISDFFENGRNRLYPIKTNEFQPSSTPKPLIFPSIFDQNFMFFLEPPPGPHFSHFLRFYEKKDDFWIPLGPSWAQNGAQNRPRGAKMLKKSSLGTPLGPFCSKMTPPFANLHVQRAPKAPPERFFTDFAWIWGPFFIIFGPSRQFV